MHFNQINFFPSAEKLYYLIYLINFTTLIVGYFIRNCNSQWKTKHFVSHQTMLADKLMSVDVTNLK